METTPILPQDQPVKFVPKEWGYEKWIVNCKEYCGKVLFLAKDKCCSWHYHKLKDEVFYIQRGRVVIQFSYKEDINTAGSVELGPGDKFYVPVGLIHRINAVEDTELFEFSTEHSDSDSYRVEKGGAVDWNTIRVKYDPAEVARFRDSV
tara:strand:- start:720 stop:1166 length:447 start_codon:yes stop_codon:yes gene_type:complete